MNIEFFIQISETDASNKLYNTIDAADSALEKIKKDKLDPMLKAKCGCS